VEQKVYAAARALVEGRALGPRDSCAICGKELSDPDSIARGIGAECWQRVLLAMETSARPLTPPAPSLEERRADYQAHYQLLTERFSPAEMAELIQKGLIVVSEPPTDE
jgi:uncharacterized protein DUF6011